MTFSFVNWEDESIDRVRSREVESVPEIELRG